MNINLNKLNGALFFPGIFHFLKAFVFKKIVNGISAVVKGHSTKHMKKVSRTEGNSYTLSAFVNVCSLKMIALPTNI